MRSPVAAFPVELDFSDAVDAPEAEWVPEFCVDFFAVAIHVVKHDFAKRV